VAFEGHLCFILRKKSKKHVIPQKKFCVVKVFFVEVLMGGEGQELEKCKINVWDKGTMHSSINTKRGKRVALKTKPHDPN